VSALADALGGRRPSVLLTLGSGLGALADEVADPLVLPFTDLGLPTATVPGHAGRLVVGTLGGVEVVVQQGRLHLYEFTPNDHHPASDVVAVVRATAEAGVGTFVVTNAAGGLRAELRPGDLVLLTDHLNLTGATPLSGPRFVDMAGAYDPALRALAHEAAASVGERLAEGVYAGLTGPAYETPAEAQMLRALGADVVGMSTVLEVIAAREAGMAVVGCALVTNAHPQPGAPPAATNHAEVLAAGAVAGGRLAAVLRALLPRLT